MSLEQTQSCFQPSKPYNCVYFTWLAALLAAGTFLILSNLLCPVPLRLSAILPVIIHKPNPPNKQI